MSHSVKYDARTGCIETKIQGELNLEEAQELIAEIGAVARERNCFLILGDYRDAVLTLSTMEIHQIPQILSHTLDLFGVMARKFKRAIVVADGLEDFHFYETVSRNNGQNIRLFRDIEEARQWLLG